MFETIRKFYKTYQKGNVKDCFYKENLIEIYRNNLWKTEGEILCFSKSKKLTYQKLFANNDLSFFSKNIIKSYMVIIRTSVRNRDSLIAQLGKICATNHFYAPIIFSDDGNILFFPKLRYNDSYFIKKIIEEHFKNRQYFVAYGSENFVVV